MSEYDVNDEFGALQRADGGQAGTYVSRLSEEGVFVHTSQRPRVGALIGRTVRYRTNIPLPAIRTSPSACGPTARRSA